MSFAVALAAGLLNAADFTSQFSGVAVIVFVLPCWSWR